MTSKLSTCRRACGKVHACGGDVRPVEPARQFERQSPAKQETWLVRAPIPSSSTGLGGCQFSNFLHEICRKAALLAVIVR
jgi:hypothetical protein